MAGNAALWSAACTVGTWAHSGLPRVGMPHWLSLHSTSGKTTAPVTELPPSLPQLQQK